MLSSSDEEWNFDCHTATLLARITCQDRNWNKLNNRHIDRVRWYAGIGSLEVDQIARNGFKMEAFSYLLVKLLSYGVWGG